MSQATYSHIVADEIVKIYDGDTIKVNINHWPPAVGKELAIRIRGIDTPEIRTSCNKEKELAYKARDRLQELISEANNVILRDIERGKYFRLVAYVYLDNVNVNRTLIEEGLAVPYNGGARKGWKWLCEGD